MPHVISVSNSEMRSFQWCKRNWYLGYYRGFAIKPENDRPVGDAKLGTRIHLALELWYGHGLDPRRAIAMQYELARAQYPSDDGNIDRLNREHDLALAMIDGYVDWVQETGVDEGIQVIGVEEELIFPSGILGVNFRAKLDQRVLRTHDGAALFLDHKTVGSFEHSTVLLHMDPQMRFYAMLEMLIAKRAGYQGVRTDGGLWNMLRRSKRTAAAKPPFYKRDSVRFNLEELRSTWMKANTIAKEIYDARTALDGGVSHHPVVPPNPGRDCMWRCAFVKICPLMDDGSNVEGALAANYVVQDPYSYYTQNDSIKTQLIAEQATQNS
jgi:hypothetical protein